MLFSHDNNKNLLKRPGAKYPQKIFLLNRPRAHLGGEGHPPRGPLDQIYIERFDELLMVLPVYCRLHCLDPSYSLSLPPLSWLQFQAPSFLLSPFRFSSRHILYCTIKIKILTWSECVSSVFYNNLVLNPEKSSLSIRLKTAGLKGLSVVGTKFKISLGWELFLSKTWLWRTLAFLR